MCYLAFEWLIILYVAIVLSKLKWLLISYGVIMMCLSYNLLFILHVNICSNTVATEIILAQNFLFKRNPTSLDYFSDIQVILRHGFKKSYVEEFLWDLTVHQEEQVWVNLNRLQKILLKIYLLNFNVEALK